MMSSSESRPRENQFSNLPGDQPTTNGALIDRELEHASREVDSNWWEAPVPNRLTAAFHVGRLLNQLSWHFQRVLFGSRADKASVVKVLDRLVGVSFKLMDEPPNHLSEVINDVRRQFEGQLWQNDAASDAVIAAYCDEGRDSDCLDGEDRRQELFDLWVDPLLRPVRNSISNTLTVTEQWAFELGNCLDEGIRPPDLYRFVTARRFTRSGYYSDDINKCGPRWGASGVRMRSFQTGELENETAWVQKLRGVLEKVGMPGTSVETTLSTWEQAESHEQRCSMPRLLEHLDCSVREHLGGCRDESTGRDLCSVLVENANDGASISSAAVKSTAAKDTASQESETMSLEARALACLIDHPDWTVGQFAKAINCNRGSLYRFTKFVAARKQMKESGKASQLRGSKNDGNIEAWDANK